MAENHDESASEQATNNSTTLHVNYDYHTAQRFPAWMALSVFSAVCLAAVNSQAKLEDSKTAADKWVLSVTVVSLILSFVSVLSYLFMRHLFVANLPEMGTTFFLLAFWGAGLPVIMNPSRGIAVLADNVVNANLYFFSWMSLATIVFITGSLLQEWTGISARDVISQSGTTPKTGKWYGLAACSMVVMVSSIRTYTASSCSGDSSEYCKRSKFGVSVGVLSFVGSIALACTLAKSTAVSFCELVCTTVMLTFWCFGVGFMTFGTAPGARIGNLYFSSWISFIIIVIIFGQGFRDFLSARSVAAQQQHGNSAPNEDFHHQEAPSIPDEENI